MSYLDELKESYILDDNGNIHRVNIVAEDTDNYYIVPKNQTKQCNKSEVHLTKEEALYNSILNAQKKGKHDFYKEHQDYIEIYDSVHDKVKRDFPELFI